MTSVTKRLFLIYYQSYISWDVFCFGSQVKFLKDYLVKKAHKPLQVAITNLRPSKTKPQQFPCSVLWTSLLFVLAAVHTAIWATSSLTKTKADSLSLWPAVVVCHPCWHTQPRPALSNGRAQSRGFSSPQPVCMELLSLFFAVYNSHIKSQCCHGCLCDLRESWNICYDIRVGVTAKTVRYP